MDICSIIIIGNLREYAIQIRQNGQDYTRLGGIDATIYPPIPHDSGLICQHKRINQGLWTTNQQLPSLELTYLSWS